MDWKLTPAVVEIDGRHYVRSDIFQDVLRALRRAHDVIDDVDVHTEQTLHDRDRFRAPGPRQP